MPINIKAVLAACMKAFKTNDSTDQAFAMDAINCVGPIGSISDGYHTFDELYEHRFQLYIALCRQVKPRIAVFKTKKHSDGTMYNGWFLLMMEFRGGKQISYHLPMRLWDECDFSERESAPPFDGHTSADVLERLRAL